MSNFHSDPSPMQLSFDAKKRAVIENEYIRWVFDPACGGEMTGAFVKNGSNTNLLATPQYISVEFYGKNAGSYSNINLPAADFKAEEHDGVCCISMSQKLADADGKILENITVKREISCHPWGYCTHHVKIIAEKRFSAFNELKIGSFYVHKNMDCCAIRKNNAGSPYAIQANTVERWMDMTHGDSYQDYPVFTASALPLSVLLLKKGVEGIEMSLGDELHQWDNIGHELFRPFSRIGFSTKKDAYDVRFSVYAGMDTCQYLEGEYDFSYRVTLPFVRKNIVPFRPFSGNIFQGAKTFETRWPDDQKIKAWKDNGCNLMRLHNDGDSFSNGQFWRDADFPPYSEEEMAKLHDCLARMKKADVAVVPYFSVKEFHPEAKEYSENADQWFRDIASDGKKVINFCGSSIFGTQMCLKSNWFEHRKKTILEVLENCDFSGIYYDWCAGSECSNPSHGKRHWDNDKLLEFLEWTHDIVGDGEMYLHLTMSPCLAAENMASLVLTEELSAVKVGPATFSPHVHFMNIAPRQVCEMFPPSTTDDVRRKFALCAILHHASISSINPIYFEYYSEEWMRDISRFEHHTAPSEGLCTCSANAGASAYWNDHEIMIVIANLSDTEQEISYSFDSGKAGIGKVDGCTGSVRIAPFQLKTVSIFY